MEIFSEYFKKEHILSRVDVRVKLLIALAIIAMVLSYKGILFPLVVTLVCLSFCLMMNIPIRVFIMRFLEPVFIASVVLILKFFLAGKDGLIDGLMIASRILGAVSIVAILGFSTPFTEFIAGLSWLKVPKGFIEILMFAYRYIFMLLEDASIIYNAQKNRLGYMGVRRGLGSFGTLSGSLVLKAFEHSHNITAAMIQRGYDGNIPMLKNDPFKPSEVVISILFITAMWVVWKI